ncbi:SNF2-like putative regulator of chromatin protein [Hamiltosporidium magnivora]|uniref:SNF2-like putative regulator of chromatin protein n=2 Tax=Hamiltosporidium TaxID=1176354 RepID=A0A4Q9L7X4_9MICR|nr:SNF2-like putative regulator of chromatin protein [Hamiltosporidium magnivora]
MPSIPVVNKPVKMKLKEDGSIEVKPSNKIISTILTSFPNKKSTYILETNSWKINIEIYEDFCIKLKQNKILYEEIPKGVINVLKKNIKNEFYDLKNGIYSYLLPFQMQGVNFALNRKGKILLADDMGLGKTIQALAIAYYYKLEWPLLIIAPASLLYNWAESINTFLKMESTIIRKMSDFGEKISIISYDQASKNSDLILKLKHQVIIVDECHYLKSQQSKRTVNLLPIIQNSTRSILLSGTPAMSRPLELFSIISAIDKFIFPKFYEYGKRYCNGRKVGHWYDYKGSSNLEELNYLLNKTFMLRRTKDCVLNELPNKFRRHVILNLDDSKTENKDSTSLNKILNENKKNLDENLTEVSDNIMTLYCEAGKLKANKVIEYLSCLIEKQIKFVVFAHHGFMIEQISKFLEETGINFIRIDGKTPVNHRQQLVNKYQNNANITVALLGLTACASGLTLTEGKAVVFSELYWNPGTMLQAEDRIHRIGQKDSVDIHYLIGKNTIDEYVWPKILKKLNVLESLGIGTNDLKDIGPFDLKQKRLENFLQKK